MAENLRKFGTFLGKIHRKRIDFCKYYVLLFRHLVRHLFPAISGKSMYILYFIIMEDINYD